MADQNTKTEHSKPQLSKNSLSQRKNKSRQAHKDHKYDARNYHQNANVHNIQSLIKFDCPVCGCKATVLVELDSKQHSAVVKCTYCMSLKPRPAELPYPYFTSYVPRLENKADAFFRFNELYKKLLPLQLRSDLPLFGRYLPTKDSNKEGLASEKECPATLMGSTLPTLNDMAIQESNGDNEVITQLLIGTSKDSAEGLLGGLEGILENSCGSSAIASSTLYEGI